MAKMNAIEATQPFVFKLFPTCQGALFAGSVVRGETTETSDLDIVIFDEIQQPADEILEPFGGRLFNVFSFGK